MDFGEGVVATDFKAPPRVIADRDMWEVLRRQKKGPCRVCSRESWQVQLHHVVPRGRAGLAGGDDLPFNLIPLCPPCHGLVENRDPAARAAVRESLSESEVAYVAGKRGLEWLDVNYRRAS